MYHFTAYIGFTQTYWLAGTDVDKEKNWQWKTRYGSETMKVFDWAPGEPNNVHGNEDCLMLFAEPEKLRMNDSPCEMPNLYICEKK